LSVPRQSSGSVEIKYTDPKLIDAAVRQFAAELKDRDSTVRRILWFGSWTKGTFSPGSDVDLCIIVDHDDRPRRERLPDYLPRRFPVGVDLFIYTEAEFRKLATEHPELYREISSGICM